MKSVRFMSKIIILAALSAAAAGIAFAAEDIPPLLVGKGLEAVVSDLNARIPNLMSRATIPGLQAALVQDGKVVWQKGFGVKNARIGGPVTDETIFEAASLTKPFFAYAVMKMVDEGLLDLDRPLHTLFTREMIEKELGHSLDAKGFRRDWFEKITARHVLSHSGGMPHGERGKVFPLFFEPGTRWKYSADGYSFLQVVVETLKGEKLDAIIKTYVLDPLGMKKSCMVWRGEYESTMANGHDAFGNPQEFRKRRELIAAASLYTTAGEYARFVCAVLNGEGLKPETQKEMLTSFTDMNTEKSLGWSLGFGLQHDANGSAFWQWGDYGIFRNYIIAYPEHKTAVVYLTNSFHGLSVCSDLVARSIGGQALGNSFLGYCPYDSPLAALFMKAKDEGAKAVFGLLPDLSAKYPDILTRQRISGLAELFADQERYPEAIAFLEFIYKENPASGRAAADLARACLSAGELERAKTLYLKAKEAKQDKANIRNIDWDLDYLQAVQSPAPLEESYMQALAGDYDVRHITVKDGMLYYFREGGTSAAPRRLLPLSRDTFFIEGVIYFRIKVEFDDQGRPAKLIGLYDNGNGDESLRNK